MEDPGKDSWIVFSPNQIKSAIGNTAFNPGNPSIKASVKPSIPVRTMNKARKILEDIRKYEGEGQCYQAVEIAAKNPFCGDPKCPYCARPSCNPAGAKTAAAPMSPQFNAWFKGSKVVDKQGNPLRCYHGTRTGIEFEEFSVEGPTFIDDEGGRSSSGSGADPTAYLGAHFSQEPSVASRFALPGKGDWMATRYEGEEEKPRVIPVYLSIKNPKDFGAESNLRWFLYQGKVNGYEEDSVVSILIENTFGWEALHSLEEDEPDPEVQEFLKKYDSEPEFRAEQHMWYLNVNSSDEDTREDVARELASSGRSKLIQAGHDGIRYRNEVEGGVSWIAFRPNQIKSALGNVGKFSPRSPRITAALKNPLLQPRSPFWRLVKPWHMASMWRWSLILASRREAHKD